ncbi:MAG TPA: SCO family protein [Sulfitobacter sp.]|uniref:SCO family protein n=1 Tax=Sulfitobacter sp. TaxID=1903071 RepID=UPI000ED30C60|nr:SCO family protein [Sulfitobacter sp.]HCQ59473.1 SCO family protein [Sulfitobacter sp.]|tara:strand:+ start:639 stop:1253 length:615 start_codon:yes stop_codon:yes gene_type:complete
MKQMIAFGAVGVAAVFLAGTAFMVLRGEDDPYASCRSSQVAGGDIGGPFELVNGAGETVTDADVITEPALLYFGYTSCPDVCPLDVDRNAAATEILEERGQSITPVFITVDPARDTPEVVGDFAEVMHPRMVGLTGSPEQVKAASQAYRTYYKAHPADENGEYLVDHSTFSYLVMPGEGVVDFFRREVRSEQMADSIGCFLDQS